MVTLTKVSTSQPLAPPSWDIIEDLDQDGMMDIDEILWGMDPLDPADGLSDLDWDTLSLAWEFDIGTDPAAADTDTDGWSDADELLLYDTDPLDELSFPLLDPSLSGAGPVMADPTTESTTPALTIPPAPPAPSIINGDFNDASISNWLNAQTFKDYQGGGFDWGAGSVGGWSAYAGSTVEVWAAGGEKFIELDGSPGNYGVKQPISDVIAGSYILAWKQTGRNNSKAETNPYVVRIYYKNGASEVKISESAVISGFDSFSWTDKAHGFQITPEQLTAAGSNPIYVAFIPTGTLNTYGTLIDKVNLLPVEVAELSPKVKNEEDNDIAGSEEPNKDKPLTPFVEVDPYINKIAHRELKVLIGSVLQDKKVTWTLESLPGSAAATIRGDWDKSPNHKDRFETSTAYGAHGFKRISQSSGETTVGSDGHSAIRVNVPPIGFNQVRIKIQIEGISFPINLIDMEVVGVVVIDPGHGGKDSGAVGRTDSSILEKELALEYSLSLKQNLINKFATEKHGVKIVMTRKTNSEYMENIARANLAKDKGADVFLSIHFNSSTLTTARGTEYVTRSTGQINAVEDDKLGVSVQGSTFTAVKASDPDGKHRDPKSGEFAVVSDTAYGNTDDYHPIRGVIIEVEFLSHETALETVKLSNATGAAIKTKFASDVSSDIYDNIYSQP